MYRRCKNCKTKKHINNVFIRGIYSFCDDVCYNDYIIHIKQTRIPLKVYKGPNKISLKRKERLKTGGEKQTFEKVYSNTKNCCICNKYVIEPKTWCFAHILNKKDYPHLRNFTNNIAFVCSIDCHHELDKKFVGVNKKELEQKILNLEIII